MNSLEGKEKILAKEMVSLDRLKKQLEAMKAKQVLMEIGRLSKIRYVGIGEMSLLIDKIDSLIGALEVAKSVIRNVQRSLMVRRMSREQDEEH